MRVRFPSGQQRSFLEEVQRLTGASQANLADRIGVCARTLRDWQREQWQMDDRSLDRLCALANIPRPQQISLLPEHWSVPKASRIGGRRHAELYGSPGTAEGRSRGGRNSQKRFRANPGYYRLLGVAVRKKIKRPAHSAELAEFLGIMLGDGGITRYQAKISLKRGHKIRNQVDVPEWIWSCAEYRIACLRGLMDTDGCVFYHRYRVNGKMYGYIKLCFTSYCRPLLDSAKRLFESLSLFPTVHRYDGHRLYLHDTMAARRYFEVVGTNNPRYRSRFESYLPMSQWVGRGGRVLADCSSLLMS